MKKETRLCNLVRERVRNAINSVAFDCPDEALALHRIANMLAFRVGGEFAGVYRMLELQDVMDNRFRRLRHD